MIKKVGGVLLMLFGVAALFALVSDFSFSVLIMSVVFIFLGYKLFKSPAKAPDTNEKIYPTKDLDGKAAVRKFNVQGVTKDNRQELLTQIVKEYGKEGAGNISLIPEPDNKYDTNAIKVMFDSIGHIGYVPKDRNESIRKLLSKKSYDIKWFTNSFSPDDADGDIYYMEVRLYKQS